MMSELIVTTTVEKAVTLINQNGASKSLFLYPSIRINLPLQITSTIISVET